MNSGIGIFGISILCVILLTTIPGLHGNAVKIRKCCPQNQVIDIYRMKCRVSGDNIWNPRLYPDDLASKTNDQNRFNIVTQIPRCPRGVGVHIFPLRDLSHISVPEAKFRLLNSGRIVAQHANGEWIDVPNNSCIDGIMNYGQRDVPRSFTGDEIDQAIITCPVADPTK